VSSIASDAPFSASQAMASVRSLTRASLLDGRTPLSSQAAASQSALRDERQQVRIPGCAKSFVLQDRQALHPGRPLRRDLRRERERFVSIQREALTTTPARHARPADALAAIAAVVNPPHESATVPLTHHGRSCARGISRARPATAELERFATGDGPTRQAGACAEGASGTRATFTVPDKARDRGAAAIQRSR